MPADAYIARDTVTPNPFDMDETAGSLLMFDPGSDIGSRLVPHHGLSTYVRPGVNIDRVLDELSMGSRFVDVGVVTTCLGRAGCTCIPVPDGMVIAGPGQVDTDAMRSEADRFKDWLAGDVYSIYVVSTEGTGGSIIQTEPPEDAKVLASVGAVFGRGTAQSRADALLKRFADTEGVTQ